MEDFAKYVFQSWLNVHQDESGWYITRDVDFTLNLMRADGWNVETTGKQEIQADDSIRTYIVVAVSRESIVVAQEPNGAQECYGRGRYSGD